MALLTSLMCRTPAVAPGGDDTPKHLGWLMLTALGIGATIGAGIFVMPGRIAEKAGPAGILSFVITGFVFLFVGICYERFARKVPAGVSAYSYVYHSIGEIFAWIVAFGLFLEYSFGASAVAIGWSQYLKKACNYELPSFFMGPTHDPVTGFHFGINVVALTVVALVTIILVFGGVTKSAKLNFILVCLKCALLATFIFAGVQHMHPVNWQPFMPTGWKGVLEGAAIAVFPYVGFDALYTFARESKSLRDTKLATYLCIGMVAVLYVVVMAIATALAPVFLPGEVINPLFKGTEASAPLASLLMASGETWCGQLIAVGAVIGIFNVLLVLSMGGPRIFRNMAEDGLLPPIFKKSHKGNPTFGVILNGVIVGLFAGFAPFEDVTDIMVLGTLVAFIFVCLGAMRLKLVNPVIPLIGMLGCLLLAFNLNPLVLKVYCISCPIGLVIYFCYGYKHSRIRLAGGDPNYVPTPAPANNGH
ncbi:MAG TPA: amino acid permease [Trichormus sp.]|jgi:APA family basic amino acid/polyamine antiporter